MTSFGDHAIIYDPIFQVYVANGALSVFVRFAEMVFVPVVDVVRGAEESAQSS